jgi:hypothetical protein
MATTTAALTIASSDLVGDALSLSTSKELHKADTTIGLDQTSGLAKTYLTATTNIDLFGAIIDTPAFEGKSHWVYICNKSETSTEYATITVGDKVIGRLYAGDFMWMPWDHAADTDTGNKHADIELAPSVATGMWFEYCMIHEGMQLPTAV